MGLSEYIVINKYFSENGIVDVVIYCFDVALFIDRAPALVSLVIVLQWCINVSSMCRQCAI
jgi:hypothetical protein